MSSLGIWLVLHSIGFDTKRRQKLIPISKANINFIIWTDFEEGVGSPHLFDPMDGQKPILRWFGWIHSKGSVVRNSQSMVFPALRHEYIGHICLSNTLIQSINHINKKTVHWIEFNKSINVYTIDPSSIESNPSTQTWNLTFVAFPVNNVFQYYSDNNFKKDILLIFIGEWIGFRPNSHQNKHNFSMFSSFNPICSLDFKQNSKEFVIEFKYNLVTPDISAVWELVLYNKVNHWWR